MSEHTLKQKFFSFCEWKCNVWCIFREENMYLCIVNIFFWGCIVIIAKRYSQLYQRQSTRWNICWKVKWLTRSTQSRIFSWPQFLKLQLFENSKHEVATRASRGSSPSSRTRGRTTSIGQILQGLLSAVSKLNFANEYAFESSPRDLHNSLFCTALQSHFFCQNFEFCYLLLNVAKFGNI